eukprot:jgi/Bigna1/131295/aug1.14_g6003
MRCNRPSWYSRRRLPRMSAGLGDLMNNFVNVSAITQLTEEVTARALAATTMKKKRNNVGCYDDGDGVLQMVFLANEDIPLVQGMWDPKNPLDFKLEYCQQQVAAAMSIPRPTRMISAKGCCNERHLLKAIISSLIPVRLDRLSLSPLNKVLVLGLGVGAIPRTLHAIYPSLAADVVEIDNDVIDTCRSFFKLRDVQPGESGVSVHHGDATEFVKRETSKAIYDIVYMDAYNEKGIPSSLLTHSFYEDMISCLKPGGLLSINLIEDVDDADVVLDRAQEMLVDPLIIRAQSTSNQAIFGVPRAKKHDSDKDTSNSRLFDLLNEMKTRAGGVDARLILPYSIAPQVLLAERLADVRARNFAWDDV